MQELERQEMKVCAAALLRPRHMHAHINSDVTPVHVCTPGLLISGSMSGLLPSDIAMCMHMWKDIAQAISCKA